MELKTPRTLPEDDQLAVWTTEIENLLAEFGEVSLCYQYLHSFSQRKYKRKYHHYQIPIIVLSTLTGTANFAADSYIPDDYKQGFSAGVGTFNIAAGIMGTLLAFLKYAEIYEGHRIAALAWAKLSRTIKIELALHRDRRKPCRDFLKICRSEYDNLMESSPSIDLDIIHSFNKKFEGKYDNVRKPVIVNGLREIKPFHDEEKKDATNKMPDKYEIMDNNREVNIIPELRQEEDKYAILDNNREVTIPVESQQPSPEPEPSPDTPPSDQPSC